MNIGIQHEIRHGMVLSVDFLGNIETHALLAIDVNQTGAARHFNPASASSAIANTEIYCGHPGDLQGTITDFAAITVSGVANIGNCAACGLGTPVDTGSTSN